MKKVLVLVILAALCIFTYYKYMYVSDNLKKVLELTEEKSFSIENYTIFGTHLNISGCIDEVLYDPELVLKNNEEEIFIKSIFNIDTKTCFKISENNNDSIHLDSLNQGNYILMVKDNNKYYNLINKTEYSDLTYYTITKNNKNNKIDIKFNNYNNKEYLNIKISNIKLPDDVYDITIDPGHGGNDPGASYKLNGKLYNESDLTLKISLLLKDELEDLGLKVKMTRLSDETLPNYGENGRGIIANKSSSKYSLSIHINSVSGTINYGGVEIYTPNDVDYSLANMLANNISNIVGYSKKQTGRVDSGVYYTYFTKEDIIESKEEMLEDNLKPYNIQAGAPYMFMIREVGGLNTHAYVDGRNPSHGYNKYFNSNITAEPYLLELGYINYDKDLENLSHKPDAFAIAIASTLKEYLDIS